MSKAKLGCERVGNEIDFKQPRSILQGLLNLFKIPTQLPTRIPKPLILASEARPGLSAKKIAARIIQRQAEAGLNVGPLGTGEVSPAEIMERIRAEEMVNALTTEARVDVAIKPGGTGVLSGVAGPGFPIAGSSITTTIQGGSALIT
jgi:hypothetical protein